MSIKESILDMLKDDPTPDKEKLVDKLLREGEVKNVQYPKGATKNNR